MSARVVLTGALLGALATGLGAGPAAGSPYIEVRVSFKLVLHPVNGNRPLTAQNTPVNDIDLQGMLDAANDSLLASYQRGYRFVMAEPAVEVGSPCPSGCPDTNPSFWYGALVYGNGTDRMKEFEDDAKANPSAYAWRTNAINVYINQGQGNGGVSSFPFGSGNSHDIVVFGGTVFDATFRAAFPAGLLHHELGHYFDLQHTHNSQPACTDNTAAACSSCPGGDDGISDTLLDRFCTATASYDPPGWEWLDIAHNNYGAGWFATPSQIAAVNRTYYNNMSYHNGGFGYGHFVLYELSEGQLDHWADIANVTRSGVRSGRTWFVQVGAAGSGTSASPYGSLDQGVNAANAGGGDIVLLRPGTYTRTNSLSTPVTLRATRSGTVVVQNPQPIASR